MNQFNQFVASFPADVPAELSRRRRIGTAPLKPPMWAPLRHRVVPQLLKPKSLRGSGVERALRPRDLGLGHLA